jgi:hypothetical protein
MAIWFWILAAWGLSFAALGGKKIRPEHLIWVLLPVDMYGIQIAGVTVKPYMFLCGFLLIRTILAKKTDLSLKSRWSMFSGIIILLLIVVNMFNNSMFQSVLSTCMLLVVWICTLIYLNDCDHHSADDIPEAILAAGIGYGAVFAVGYLLTLVGVNLPGLFAQTRAEPGIFMQFNNMYEGKLLTAFRLRGFTIDPNTMVTTFLFSMVISLLRIATGKIGVREVLGLILSVLCIVLSNSRMGLLCCGITATACIIVGYKMAGHRARFFLTATLLGITGFLIIISSTDVFADAVAAFLSSYKNRSGLNDDYGRFTIWREAVSVLGKHGFFFGIGFGQMQNYTATARACHNTWLEFLCSGGILLGSVIIFHFACMSVSGLRYAVSARSARSKEFIWTMVLGVIGVIISLLAVDNVTSSYLWFGMSVIAGITNGCWKE